MRMPDRLQFQLDAGSVAQDAAFPALGLLTLVENAVRHGVDPSECGGRIDVTAQADAASGEIRITVADTGVGMRETAASGTGLANLRARLSATFGSAARLEMHEVKPHGVRAEIVFTPAAAQPT
jgi:LytS/YehU family sensor histidine kinase